MSENSANSKRIAKNTLMLYVRMLLIMCTTLYTSRIVLDALGVDDYGIYNLIGGMVAMFSMISSSLSSAISRFITVELGKGNQERLNTIFSTSIIIQIVISLIILILVNSIGIWFITNKMVISPDRLNAAKWVLQFSVITLIINIISIPYNAAIIAHEKMSAFAYIGIFQAIGQLVIAYLIRFSPFDSLVWYAILMSIIALVVRFMYGVYCNKHFEECKQVRLCFNRSIFKEMFSFASWNFIGSSSALLRDQGGNMLLNIFGGGVAVNAAMGIATQVKAAVVQFTTNFMTAMNPQIIKSYSINNHEYMMTLLYKGARISAYMLLLISLPILFNTSFILSLWLKVVPNYTVIFVQLVLIFGICESISQPLITAQFATGDIKKYQIIVGGLQLFNLPISYIFLRGGAPPYIVLIVAIFISMCCFSSRLYLLRSMIDLSAKQFFVKVFLNIVVVSLVSSLIPYLVSEISQSDWSKFLTLTCTCILSTISTIYFIGCTHEEREFIRKNIKSKIIKK